MTFNFSGADPELQMLLTRAYTRLTKALKDKTKASYVHIFKCFLTFLFSHSFSYPPVPVQALLAYIEHLVHLPLAYPTICNQVSALKYMFNRFHWPGSTCIFSDPLVSQLLHSIDVNVPRPISTHTILSIEDLTALVQATFTHPLGVFLRPLFLLGFFGFLRQFIFSFETVV